jgi:dolichol-phosphate mannosyltransferase
MHRTALPGLGRSYVDAIASVLDRPVDVICQMDGDLSHDPQHLPDLIAGTEHADVVIGSRYVPGAAIPNWTLLRLAISRVGNLYASFALGLKVADSTAGYRVYRRSALEAMDYRSVEADGYGFQIEMTYRARRAGLTIREIPIVFVDRTHGTSKMSSGIVVEALWLVTVWALRRALGAPSAPERPND